MVPRIFRLMPAGWLLALLLAGCTSTPISGPPFSAEQDPALKDSPAFGLWQQSVSMREQGDLAAAGRLLERAQSMEPQSSWLYRELAELRLRQGEAAAAEGLARKALRLAPVEHDYRAALWQLVGVACARQGRQQCADEARASAAQEAPGGASR